VLKNLFNDIRLINEANDAHLSLAFGTGEKVLFHRLFGSKSTLLFITPMTAVSISLVSVLGWDVGR
jgi:hypothetical protein